MTPSITWEPPFCGGDGGNACLQLGRGAEGTIHLRETAAPNLVIATTPHALKALSSVARRGALPRQVRD
jgi:hypothetical protein